MRFSELSEKDKIQAVKDQFIAIVEIISADHNKLNQYFKLEEPKWDFPVIEIDNGDTTIIARNELAKVAANISNEKLLADFNSKKTVYDAILKRISSFKKKEDCKCPPSIGPCLDVNLTSGAVFSELEPLIDAARIEIQTKTF